MAWLTARLLHARLWQDTRAQDYTEYALLGGFVVLAVGAIMPAAATQISSIYGSVRSELVQAGG